MANGEAGRGWGDPLREARARKRVDLEQAFHETRISPVYLELLERSAPITAFPAPVYARAFLREYARYLGIDAEPLLQDLEAAGPAPDPAAIPYEPEAESARRLRRMWQVGRSMQ